MLRLGRAAAQQPLDETDATHTYQSVHAGSPGSGRCAIGAPRGYACMLAQMVAAMCDALLSPNFSAQVLDLPQLSSGLFVGATRRVIERCAAQSTLFAQGLPRSTTGIGFAIQLLRDAGRPASRRQGQDGYLQAFLGTTNAQV